MVIRTKLLAALACAILLLSGRSVDAGLLAGNPFAFNDGNGPLAGAWTGTTPFSNAGLTGTIDWAVFSAATFNAQFGGGGYIPPAGQLVYAHQIFTTGPAVGVSGMDIMLAGNPAGNGGSFSSGGVAGVTAAFASATPLLASFILTGETNLLNPSQGLVYASPNPPQLTGLPFVVDGGLSASAILPIGIPGRLIPEPATGLVAAAAGFVLLVGRRRRSEAKKSV